MLPEVQSFQEIWVGALVLMDFAKAKGWGKIDTSKNSPKIFMFFAMVYIERCMERCL